MLDFQNISIYRKGEKVLDHFNLKAPDGVILALLGEDKEAKSMLLKAASGGEKPEEGQIYMDGISIYEEGRNAYCNFGYMSKEYGFYNLLKVEEYYELFLSLYKVGGRYRSRRIEEVLEMLEMTQYKQTFIGELPIDTFPFLYLGKAILQEPEWLLMDDPFDNMSVTARKKMIGILLSLHEKGTSMIINTSMYPEMMGFITDVVVIEEGKNLTVKVNNADADMGTASQIAQSFVTDNMDLICAIATPSAQAAYNAAMENGIPVVYTAVTNPVEAELATDDKMPVGAVTGTSDQLPVEAQLKMIREILPDAKTIGILYTTSEANSVYSISQYEELADQYGFTLETAGITSSSEISLATADLLTKVDCLTNLTDNTVVSSLPAILDQANEKGIPVFGSEIEQVKIGCLAAEGIDYISLGKDTGKMAAKILKGEAKAEDMEYQLLTESNLYVNEKVAENLGITVPDSMNDRAVETFSEISEG